MITTIIIYIASLMEQKTPIEAWKNLGFLIFFLGLVTDLLIILNLFVLILK